MQKKLKNKWPKKKKNQKTWVKEVKKKMKSKKHQILLKKLKSKISLLKTKEHQKRENSIFFIFVNFISLEYFPKKRQEQKEREEKIRL